MWHEVANLELNIRDRLCFCSFLRDWSEEDFLHLVERNQILQMTSCGQRSLMKFLMKRGTMKSSSPHSSSQEINLDRQATRAQLEWTRFPIRDLLSACDSFHERPCLCSGRARDYISLRQSALQEGPRNLTPSQRQRDRLFRKRRMAGSPRDLNACEPHKRSN